MRDTPGDGGRRGRLIIVPQKPRWLSPTFRVSLCLPRHAEGMPSRLSIASRNSMLSIASESSILSIGSVGSALSIGSIGSFGSVLSLGSSLSLGSAMSFLSLGSAFSSVSTASLFSEMSTRALRGEGERGQLHGWQVPVGVAGTMLASGALYAALRRRRSPSR